jgi:hypothetical protein
MCLPYQTTHINPNFGTSEVTTARINDCHSFGPSDFEKLKPQLFSEMFLSEARDLLTCVSHGSMTTISLGLHISENSTLNLHFSPKCSGFLPHVLLDRMTEIHFGSPGFRNLNSQLLLARLFPECFHPEHTIS